MKAVFIDRDGTMGGGYNIEYPSEYKAFDFTKDNYDGEESISGSDSYGY